MDQVPGASAGTSRIQQQDDSSVTNGIHSRTADKGESHEGPEHSGVATLLRIDHIGLNDYLFRRRVPRYPKPDCECGWPRQTPKHIILFYSAHTSGRGDMIAEANTSDYAKLLSTEAGLPAVTRSFLQRDILTQFSLARTPDDAKPRRRGRKPGMYVDEDEDDGEG